MCDTANKEEVYMYRQQIWIRKNVCLGTKGWSSLCLSKIREDESHESMCCQLIRTHVQSLWEGLNRVTCYAIAEDMTGIGNSKQVGHSFAILSSNPNSLLR